MASRANRELRSKMRRKGIFNWMLSRELDISEGTLVKWLDTELEGDRKKQVEAALDRLIARMRQYGYR